MTFILGTVALKRTSRISEIRPIRGVNFVRETYGLNVPSNLSRHGTASKMHRKIAKTQYKLLHLAKNRDHDTSQQRTSELESIVNKKIVQNGSETKDWATFTIFTIFIFFVLKNCAVFSVNHLDHWYKM